jgi:hypothetical protein
MQALLEGCEALGVQWSGLSIPRHRPQAFPHLQYRGLRAEFLFITPFLKSALFSKTSFLARIYIPPNTHQPHHILFCSWQSSRNWDEC